MAAWARRMWARVRGVFGGGRRDADRAREIAAHLALLEDDLRSKGMTPEEALRQAHIRLGNTAVIREEVRQMDSVPVLENLGRDVSYAMRQLRKSPGFAVAAIVTLALGIGAVAAMFSVLDAVVLRPLPYRNADRMVSLTTKASAGYFQPESWPEFQDLRRMTKTFREVVAIGGGGGVTLNYGGRAVFLHAVQGSDNFFDLFGVKPLLGRTYLPGEDQIGKSHVLVLSYGVWQQYFGGQKSIVGKAVDLDGNPYTVIGVMPAGFRVRFDASNVVYTPLQLTPDLIKSRGTFWLPTFGLLKKGVTLEQATADMNHVLDELGKQYPDNEQGKTARVVSYSDALNNVRGHNDRTELWVLLAAVFSVLLIACTNVAGLLLARGLMREREMAVRAALGAGRQRLVRQMLTESVVLGLAGGVLGLGLGYALLAAMQQFLEKAFARGGEVHLNLTAVAVTFVVSMAASVAAGLAPALRAARVDSNQTLKSGGRSGTTRQQHRLRGAFVVVQVALSLILLVCSGLLLLGLRKMMETDLGFNPHRLLTLEVNIPNGDYKGRDFVQALVEPLEARVAAIPGVKAVGSNDLMPILQSGSNSDLQLVGRPPDPINKQRLTEMRFVTPGYFAAMQLPIMRGRDITAQDVAKSQPVAVVNEAWVKEFLTKGEDPLAQAFADDPQKDVRIVGVARSGRQRITESPSAEADFPMAQMPDEWRQFFPGFYLFVRTSVPPTSISAELRRALHDVAPNVAFRTPETMETVLSDALVTNRMLSWLFGLFAGIAVVLTAIGLYGLLSQEVASRTRDIGVRMALGATRAGVARMILIRTGVLLGIGVGAGLAGVFLLRQMLDKILMVRPESDAGAIALLVVGLALIGLVAALVPMRRASRVEPMQALRME
jgi:putative ABC transport system permease protein